MKRVIACLGLFAFTGCDVNIALTPDLIKESGNLIQLIYSLIQGSVGG